MGRGEALPSSENRFFSRKRQYHAPKCKSKREGRLILPFILLHISSGTSTLSDQANESPLGMLHRLQAEQQQRSKAKARKSKQ